MIRSLLGLGKHDKSLQSFLKSAFDISTSRPDLYRHALRHTSAAAEILPGLKNSNERLEFLGDAFIDAILAHYLFQHFPHLDEGELTKMKSKVVRRDNLNRIGHDIGIHHLLEVELGKQEIHDSMLGNALEALFGALFLDKGFATTRNVALRFFAKHGLTETLLDEVDSKSKLHEWCQKAKKSLQFEVALHHQTNGTAYYLVHALVNQEVCGSGEGSSKKAAEQQAAKAACEKLLL
jgi:ribonuclease-3